jgi:MOSC domain-containing protein YiiM
VPQIGRVEWLGVRPAHGQPMLLLNQVKAIEGHGLDGDRAAQGRAGGNRQVTLFQAEHLAVLSSFLGDAELRPETVRRNLLISGINLLALLKLPFRIGDDVVLVGVGPCAPCAKMEGALGRGGFQAMRGHGGITARVESGGWIRVGDEVRVEALVESPV